MNSYQKKLRWLHSVSERASMTQLEILKNYLDVFEIPYEINDDQFMERIYLCNGEFLYLSVIHGRGSYGFDWGLLEIQGLLTDEEMKNDSVLGYLTAIEIANRIDAYWRDEDE